MFGVAQQAQAPGADITQHGSRTSVQAGTGSKMVENINNLLNMNQCADKSADQGGAGESISSPNRPNATSRAEKFGHHQVTENHL